MEDTIIPIVALILLGVIAICGIQLLNITFYNNVPSRVLVDGKEVYSGSSAGFSVTSGGYTTQVIIKGGFLYFFPQKVYVSKDVVVEGKK